MWGDSWGSREGEGGVLMTVDRALSVGRWRGTGCPQQASLWRAMEVSGRALGREQTVRCVVTTRQADALQRNYLWEQEEGVPGTLGLLSVSLRNQSALCLWRPPVADPWALPCTPVHRAASAGPDGRGGGSTNTEGSVTTRAWGSPWQPRSCVSETDCWGGLADGHQLFRREVPLPFHLKVTCGCLFAWLLQPPPPLSNVWSCLKYFPKPFLHLPGHLPLLSGRTLWQKGMIWGTKGQQWTLLATAAPQVNMPVGCLSEIFPELFSLGVWIFKLASRRGEVLSKQPL